MRLRCERCCAETSWDGVTMYKNDCGYRNFFAKLGVLSGLLGLMLSLSLVQVMESGVLPSGAASGTPAGSSSESLEQKIEELSVPPSEQPKSFRPITITDSEANAYLKTFGPEFLPPAVESPELRIYSDHISGSAEVDFDRLQALGKQTNDIGMQVVGTLFKGKQKVSATGKLSSGDGKAQVAIQDLSVGTTDIPDWLTEAMLQSYMEKAYQLDLSKPFPLPDHVTRIDLAAGQATFVRSSAKRPNVAKPAQ
jgi:hypothetical protein